MSRMYRFGGALLIAVVASTVALAVADDADKPDRKPDIFYLPTPQKVVDKMLEVAKVTKDDVVYDLGCGDGRIVCTAAKKYGCKAIGYDIDPARIKDSEANKAKLDAAAQKLVKFEKADIFKLDLSKATVITLYLLPELNVKLIPQLKKLKAGSRIVSHDFDMRGVTPDKGFPIMVTVKDDGAEREHSVYKWTTPLKFEKE